MSAEMMVQCKLQKGDQVDVAWINDDPKLKPGVTVRIKRDEWEDGWEVAEMYSKRPRTEVMADKDAHKYHRQNTDI